jgi:hypothetical protein
MMIHDFSDLCAPASLRENYIFGYTYGFLADALNRRVYRDDLTGYL